MATFGLTVIAALTLWSIVYLLLHAFVGGHPNFPGQNLLEFVVNASLLLMVGWITTGLGYAVARSKMTESRAFAACVVTMAIFAYLIAVSTHNKLFDR